jgi:hypothetical protein
MNDQGKLRIRSTERPHDFSRRLYEALGIQSLQGLTLDSRNRFTAGIEAVEFESVAEANPAGVFTGNEWLAKYALCRALSIPLFLVTHTNGDTSIEVLLISEEAGSLRFELVEKMTFDRFRNWWATIKGTVQTKGLIEARSRVSLFDTELEKGRLSWGGNIDGYLLAENRRPLEIIEERFTGRSSLESYDPAEYYLGLPGRGGDYHTWQPLALLAIQLRIPLVLLTFERNSDRERVGFAVVNEISSESLSYRHGPPSQTLVQGIEEIRKTIQKSFTEAPPSQR